MKSRVLLSVLSLVMVLIVVACTASYAPTQPTAVPTELPTAVPSTAMPATPPTTGGGGASPSSATSLMIAKNPALGAFLADDQGRTLYLFTKDTKGTSSCYDKCAAAWPPLMSSDQLKMRDGVSADLISTTVRTDGSMQVTYNGWPLYYFAADKASGDVNGQAVGKVWWVVSGEGNPIKPVALAITTTEKLGQILVDGDGRTLYIYTKDAKDASTCYDKCETAWPPLLQTDKPIAGNGVDATLLGTTQRKDGTIQVTYNGMPLYYFFKDHAAGDVTGQGVGSVWYVLSPGGTIIK
jgi:predicted lipoprotein with Yx(FWY)xxD motif